MRKETIVVKNLCKSYGKKEVLRGINFSVYENEIFGILGKNGAGKTTLMEILEGYGDMNNGEVSLFDIPIERYKRSPGLRRKIGVSFQEPVDYLRITAKELLEHFSVYYDDPFDVHYLLEKVSLIGSKDMRISRLSGGQKHRLDIALSLLGKPDLIFLDEPTSGLDPQSREEFYKLVEELKNDGKTFVLTSHYLNEVERLANRVMFIVGVGAEPVIGTVQELYRRYSVGVTVEYGETDAHFTRKRVKNEDLNSTLQNLIKKYPAGIPNLNVKKSSLEDLYDDIVKN